MSDPARDGFTCCGVLMEPVELPAIDGEAAVLCQTCCKWRHLLPRLDSRRPLVVREMDRIARELYRRRSDAL